MDPQIITADRLGLQFKNLFGSLGQITHVTVHHSAGPVPRSYEHAKQLIRSYHADHAAKGWGGIGYHFCILPQGRILGLRPVALKGAHVGGWNTGNVGVMFLATTGDRPTANQVDSFRWLLKNAHTPRMPRAHRTPRPLNRPHTDRQGHNDWSGHESNACPGTFKPILDFHRS